MEITTRALAVHSIQNNMVSTQQSGRTLMVLLANGKILVIQASSEDEIKKIDDALHYYPSQGASSNSRRMNFNFTTEIVEPTA